MTAAPLVLAELDALDQDIAMTCDSLLGAAESGLAKVAAAKGGDLAALEDLTGMLWAVMEACALQDIAGQRTTKIRDLLAGKQSASSLLNGPQAQGQAMSQAAADVLLEGASCPPASHG